MRGDAGSLSLASAVGGSGRWLVVADRIVRLTFHKHSDARAYAAALSSHCPSCPVHVEYDARRRLGIPGVP